MRVLSTVEEMMAWADAQPGHIGLVPTMGYLHAGHASLMTLLRPRCDHLVVSIYVNPLQFGPSEDLDSYPRDLEADLAVCRGEGVDVVFAPTDLYPDGFVTSVNVDRLTDGLCGAKRPGHFEGVTTVVARLFGVTRCRSAVFGDKDYQQLQVLRRMARDLGMPVEVIAAPLIRDADGLALSSRNTYLSAEERARGLSLHRALHAVVEAAAAGERDVARLRERGLAVLDVDRLDYFEIVDADDLSPLARVDGRARVLVAAFVGRTRLIDNMAVED